MVEYMEECILSFIHTDQFLDIIQQQDIDILIKVQEVIRCIFTDRISKLYAEKMRRNIQYLLFRMKLTDTGTNCMTQVCFAYSRRAEYE